MLRKQGQAAIKRLEGVFEKEVEKLREKTLKDLQKELDAALEAKDLDKAVALREAIQAFEDGDESGLSSKADVANKKKVKKRIPKDAVHFSGHRYLLVDRGMAWLPVPGRSNVRTPCSPYLSSTCISDRHRLQTVNPLSCLADWTRTEIPALARPLRSLMRRRQCRCILVSITTFPCGLQASAAA